MLGSSQGYQRLNHWAHTVVGGPHLDMKGLQTLAGRGMAQRHDLKLTCTTCSDLTTASLKVILISSVRLTGAVLADQL